MTETVKSVTLKLLDRYKSVINEIYDPENDFDYFDDQLTGQAECTKKNLLWMIQHLKDNMETFPIDKSSRWLGFIQGVMASNSLINVEQERNFSRPLFHLAYKTENIKIPETHNHDSSLHQK